MSRTLVEKTLSLEIYWDDEANVIWCVLDKQEQTLELAKQNIDAQERARDALEKKMTRVVVDMRNTPAMNREARAYYASERTATIQRATALLVSSPVTRVIANFFMGLNKPLSPTRMFTDPDAAVNWLQAFEDV